MNAVTRAWVLDGQVGMPAVVARPEAQSQSFKRGQLVYLVDDTGTQKLTILDSNGTNLPFGMALQDASGTEDTMLLVQPLPVGSRVVMCLNSTGVADSAIIDEAFEIEAASGFHVLDADKSTVAGGTDGKMHFRVKGRWADAASTDYARYICEIRTGHSGYNA